MSTLRERSSFHGNARHVSSFAVALFEAAVRRSKRITLRVIVSFAVAGQSAICCPRGEGHRFLDFFTRQGTRMIRQGRLYARTFAVFYSCFYTLSVSLTFERRLLEFNFFAAKRGQI